MKTKSYPFEDYQRALDSDDPQWLKDRILAMAMADPMIDAMQLKALYELAKPEVC